MYMDFRMGFQSFSKGIYGPLMQAAKASPGSVLFVYYTQVVQILCEIL